MVVPEIIYLKLKRVARNALQGSLRGLDKLEFLICHHKLGLDTLCLEIRRIGGSGFSKI